MHKQCITLGQHFQLCYACYTALHTLVTENSRLSVSVIHLIWQ